jgi:hypothetical protein
MGTAFSRTPTNFSFFDPRYANNAPTLLSTTGLYSDIASKTMDPGIYGYDVNVSRWSDGVIKERYIILPNDSQITYFTSSSFDFPAQTTFAQNFYVDTIKNNPASRVLLETRLLVYGGPDSDYGWYGFSYVWDRDQQEARLRVAGLIDTARDTTVIQHTAGGGEDTLQWQLFNQLGCSICHIRPVILRGPLYPDGQQVLSFAPVQINRTSPKTNSQNQITYFYSEGLFKGTAPNPDTIFSWSEITDTQQTLEHRCRSYFAANCGNCHWTLGYAESSIIYGNHNMDYFDPDKEMNFINNKVTQPYFPDIPMGLDTNGLPIIFVHYGYGFHGQFPDSSVFLLLMNDTIMPRIGVNQPDTTAIRILSEWVMSMPVSVEAPAGPAVSDYAVFRSDILYVRALREDIRLFDLTGAEITLSRLARGMYRAERELPVGVYLVEMDSRTSRVLKFRR